MKGKSGDRKQETEGGRCQESEIGTPSASKGHNQNRNPEREQGAKIGTPSASKGHDRSIQETASYQVFEVRSVD